jgi:hypothetical protein
MYANCKTEPAEAIHLPVKLSPKIDFTLPNTAPLTRLPLLGLLAGRGGWREPCAAERPAGSRTAPKCAPTRKEPVALRVRPRLGY